MSRRKNDFPTLDWDSVAKRIVVAVKRGDLSVKSIGLTRAEEVKVYRWIKQESYPRSVVFFLLENIFDFHFSGLRLSVGHDAHTHQQSDVPRLRQTLARLPEHVKQCLELQLLLSEIRET